MGAADSAQSTGRSTKFRAILAGGLVLGVGAAITLAAWTDEEFASGNFGAGTFVFEGSINGTDFTSNPDTPGQEISFEVGAQELSPGDAVSGAYSVQVTEGDYDATVILNDGTSEPATGLTYSVVETETHGCDSATVGDPLITDAALGSGAADLELGEFQVGDARSFCFTVTAGDDLEQGSAATGIWQFTATSME